MRESSTSTLENPLLSITHDLDLAVFCRSGRPEASGDWNQRRKKRVYTIMRLAMFQSSSHEKGKWCKSINVVYTIMRLAMFQSSSHEKGKWWITARRTAMLEGTYTGLVATAALLCLLHAGTTASIEGDSSSVTRTDAGTCTVHSNPHYSTFDGANFLFVGPCTYVLTWVCSPSAPSETPLSHFSVEVKNELRGNSSVSAVQQVKVEVENLRVSLHKRQNHRVMVNGIWRKLPLSLNGGTVNIRGNAASVVVETNFNLFVSYDDAGAVHITVPVSYSGKVCGMCGNFNHLRDDDYRTPGSSEAADSTTFGQSRQSEACDLTVVPQECPPTEEAEYASEPYCGSLVSRHGPFSGCQSVLGAESYFRSCVAGMCGAGGDPEVLCEALQSYSDMCLKAGVLVPAWRNSTMCPLECGVNSHYNACAKGCPEVCASMDTQGACGSCEERCECDPGFKLSGGSCVPAEDCGCWIKGEHYERGVTFMEGECDRVCQCMGGDRLQCAASSCMADEVCKVKEGVKGCFPSSPATCHVYGDPHYITFDGKAYTFQGGCSYTLAKTCGTHTPVQFSVTGQNWNPKNESSAKLGAVVLETRGLHVKMENYSATVNHVWQHLPVTVNGTYGMVKVYKKKQYTVMETTFGLRILLDDQSRLFLQLDERYKGEMCGLCGTYSDDQGDDFLTPNSTKPETNVVTFANSWRVNSPEDDRCVASPPAPQSCDSHLDDQGYRECSKLLCEAFKPCHPFVHPTPYIDSCVSDHCASGGNMHVTCDSLRSYVTTCQVANVILPPWWNDTACDSLPDPPTIPPVTTPDKELCPLDCNFDNSECWWEQIVQDSFDWRRQRGPTPSDLTGPTQDHTTGGGSYMYIEGDGVSHGDSARMMSPKCQNGPGQYCLRFWYHMYGQATAMALNVYQLDQHNRNKKLWSKANNQGSTWYPAEVDIIIDGSFQIIMEGIRGSDPRSDVAFDDVSIHYESCSVELQFRPQLMEELPHTQDLCGFTQLMTDVFDWTRHSGSTPTAMTGPSADHTKGSPFGHYLYIEANSVSNGDTARLLSSECSDPGPQCLQFWYHMSGSAETMGLHVYLLQDRYADGVWGKRNNQGDSWQQAQVDLMTTGPFQIIFEGHRGTTDQSDVTIDDVSLHRGRCAAPSCPKNSHYIPCISACQPTCKHLHGPPDCRADEPCVQGCVCEDGFVLKQRVCVPIQQCGCVGSNGNSHHFKENWYTEHCHQKCECDEGDGLGEIDCDDEDGCDGDAVCLQNEAGQYFCKSTDFSECTINGDSEYRTFDNMKHDFEGRNSYILVQTTGLSKNQPDVYIEAIIEIVNQDGVDSHGDSSHGDSSHGDSSDEDDKHKDSKEKDSNDDSHDDSKENDNRLRLRGLKIRVDGRSTRAPVSPAGGLRILERSSRIYLKTDFGLSVEFDGDSRAEIILPHTYKMRVGGLCGNFDGKKKNDMMKPDSNQAKSMKEFGES
ncbi:unnamed protein product [Coregonus sp. 'balchen']|nr:unnamed protein product [Coregonus sp. 'balchen']